MIRTVCAALLAASLVVVACDDEDPIEPEQDTFTAALTGAAERPTPVTTTATGTFTATLNPTTKTFSYTLTQTGLTGVTAAHIHGPGTVDQAVGVIVPLTTPTTSPVTGTFGAAQITAATVSIDSLITLMRTGRAYVNVHTTAFPGGNIRGQLVLQ
jgi:hypothetical protein